MTGSTTGSLDAICPTDPVWTIEVDVCIARPPSPKNVRTATVMLAHPCDSHDDQWNVQLLAIHMVMWSVPNCVMPTASRVVCVEI